MTPQGFIDTLIGLDPLCDLPRVGWLLRGVNPCESVAEHCFGVAVAAMLLVDILRAEGRELDGEVVLRMALLHDAAEAKTGDIPRPARSPAVNDALVERERELVDALLGERLSSTWEAAERGTSLESRVVRAADRLQLLTKVLVYQQRGFRGLDDFWANRDNFRDCGIQAAETIFAELLRRAGQTA